MRSNAQTIEGQTRPSSLTTALLLLKCFSEEQHEIGIGPLAIRLGVSKSTAHRVAVTLLREGMLEQDEQTRKYRLGLSIFELGFRVRCNMTIYKNAKELLGQLQAATQETVNLAILRGQFIIYINSIASQNAIKVNSVLGARLPAHCSAEGKILLTFNPTENVERNADHDLTIQTQEALTVPNALHGELLQIRDRGYAIDNEESDQGVRSIAVPLFDYRQQAIAAIGIAGPSQRLGKRKLMSFLPKLASAAKEISIRPNSN